MVNSEKQSSFKEELRNSGVLAVIGARHRAKESGDTDRVALATARFNEIASSGSGTALVGPLYSDLDFR